MVEQRAAAVPTPKAAPKPGLTKRGLLLRDGLDFLVLCSVTLALFAVTLLLFRSLEKHREALGDRWSERGKIALQQGEPAQAVVALRTALTFEPNRREDQLLLAQALAEAGRTEEAINYFLTLWESRPGEGFVNLQLARLARKKGDAQEATNYYRAAIFGNWGGDGVERRRETRLELADYLGERGDVPAARTEILIAAGNAPKTDDLEIVFGDRLQRIGDLPDALTFYRMAIASNPHRRDALAKAGRAAYALADYASAAKLLTSALREPENPRNEEQRSAELTALADNSRRLQELNLSRDLPAAERAGHLLLASGIARKRLQTCSAPFDTQSDTQSVTKSGPRQNDRPPTVIPTTLLSLAGRWIAAEKTLNRRALDRDAALEDSVEQLIDDTEAQTEHDCGTPTGDDALLLMLARSPHRSAP